MRGCFDRVGCDGGLEARNASETRATVAGRVGEGRAGRGAVLTGAEVVEEPTRIDGVIREGERGQQRRRMLASEGDK